METGLIKTHSIFKDIDVALVYGCIENDCELDAEIAAKYLYGKYKKDRLQQVIDQGCELYKENKQQYGQRHGILRIKQK